MIKPTTWTKKDGTVVVIKEMTDSHLNHAILMLDRLGMALLVLIEQAHTYFTADPSRLSEAGTASPRTWLLCWTPSRTACRFTPAAGRGPAPTTTRLRPYCCPLPKPGCAIYCPWPGVR